MRSFRLPLLQYGRLVEGSQHLGLARTVHTWSTWALMIRQQRSANPGGQNCARNKSKHLNRICSALFIGTDKRRRIFNSLRRIVGMADFRLHRCQQKIHARSAGVFTCRQDLCHQFNGPVAASPTRMSIKLRSPTLAQVYVINREIYVTFSGRMSVILKTYTPGVGYRIVGNPQIDSKRSPPIVCQNC
jgi:hypothetical protein